MADKAAQAPRDRAAWVESSFRDSKLQTDPAAKAWGLQIQPNMSLVRLWGCGTDCVQTSACAPAQLPGVGVVAHLQSVFNGRQGSGRISTLFCQVAW